MKIVEIKFYLHIRNKWNLKGKECEYKNDDESNFNGKRKLAFKIIRHF